MTRVTTMRGGDRPPATMNCSETIGTAFSRLRRRTSSVPLDPPVARTDVRRDLLLADRGGVGRPAERQCGCGRTRDGRTAVSRLAARASARGW